MILEILLYAGGTLLGFAIGLTGTLYVLSLFHKKGW